DCPLRRERYSRIKRVLGSSLIVNDSLFLAFGSLAISLTPVFHTYLHALLDKCKYLLIRRYSYVWCLYCKRITTRYIKMTNMDERKENMHLVWGCSEIAKIIGRSPR